MLPAGRAQAGSWAGHRSRATAALSAPVGRVDAEIGRDAVIPVARAAGSGALALNDDGDEVFLLTRAAGGGWRVQQGRCRWGWRETTAPQAELQRAASLPRTADVRAPWLRCSCSTCTAAPQATVPHWATADRAVGDAGREQHFSPEGVALPHYLAAAASADGLTSSVADRRWFTATM